ncbi:MAG: HAMP domain-containing protein, partial [Nitrosopumilaceae archaeon]|nr:HAMP domain-containing protein [Nitrosopumilaceae archaeon]NIU89031.1 HAMP domain-containing protein [Nitrosopumilaceae archaeon]NIV67132.1 HAMP domain-containing protein [Nitrosopumilaceae archaeon]NIX63166.1 HAMP domain-containing protein [Nitrosopumilaceae archaeon]
VVSHLVTKPLKNLASTAKSISQGRFKVSATKSKLSELQTIEKAFDEMTNSLKRLINTERQ